MAKLDQFRKKTQSLVWVSDQKIKATKKDKTYFRIDLGLAHASAIQSYRYKTKKRSQKKLQAVIEPVLKNKESVRINIVSSWQV